MVNRNCLLAIAMLVIVGPALAQVATGVQAFGSFGGGPFDLVNLGNLNTHFDIPIIQKGGRGAPYTFTLSYDTSVWHPVSSSGTTTWAALPNYGWSFTVPQYAFGYVTAQTLSSWQQPCFQNQQQQVSVAVYGFFVYVDPKGANHPFPQSFTISYQSIPGCPLVNAPPTSGSAVAVDGSGYTVNASGNVSGASAGIVTRDGAVVNLQQTSSTTTDANGNEVTSATDVHGNMQITDTLGQNVLTISGSNPVTLAYTAPAGPAQITINYTSYNIWTNFGCSSVVDPTINSQPLITSIVLQDSTKYQFTYEDNTSYAGYKTGRLTSVSLPTGGTIAYQYPGANDGANCSDGSALGLQRTVTPGGVQPQGVWTYSRAAVTGGWQTTVTSPPDPVNSGNANDVTVINFAEDSSNSTQNFFETQRLVYQGSISGALLGTVTTCYNTNYAHCSSTPVSTPIQQIDTYAALGSKLRASEVTYNGYGLVTDDKEYDYGVTLNNAPLSTKLVRETAIGYASLGNGIVSLPSSVVVSDWSSGSQVPLNSTTYSYDQATPTSLIGTPQHVAITGSRGNLTTIATQAGGGTTLNKVYKYYDTGNVQSVTDLGTTSVGGPNLTTYNYADATSTCGNAFPTSVSEPLSLSQSYAWNCVGGAMTSALDENGKTSRWDYITDTAFWRPNLSRDQLLNETDYSYATNPSASEASLKFNGTISISDLRSTVDGFGRPMLSQRAQGPALTQYDSTQTNYDVMGRAYQTTMPFQAGPGGTSLIAPTTTTTYDALGRLYTVTDSGGGTVSYTYTGNDVLQVVGPAPSGENPKQKQLEYDGLGRLISVCEVTAGTTAWPGGACGQTHPLTGYLTKYTYDAVGNLLTVTQNAQSTGNTQTRTYTYDMLNRLKSEINPETGTSPGIVYTYDVACTTTPASPGDLTKVVDKAGNATCYGYDQLHRLKDAGHSGPTCRHFRYDTQTPPSGVTVSNTLARIAEAYTDNCSSPKITDEWYGYDADGHLTDTYESTPNSAGYYHSQVSYWANGAVASLSALKANATAIFPTIYYGTSTGAGLDGEGRIVKVNAASGTNPVTGTTYVTSGTSEPIGALTAMTLGSTDQDSFTFDPNTGRPATYTFKINSVNDTGRLTWNANGTLGTFVVADSLAGTTDSETCNYYYDDLARLAGKDAAGFSVDCGTKWQQLFTLDPFGNVIKAGTSNFAPTYSTSTNQFSTIPGVTGPYYDSNGNLTKDNLNTYTWDPNWGNPASLNSTNLIYDANGLMVEQQNGSASTQIIYGPAGKTAIMSGQTLVKAFVGLPDGATAIYTPSSGSPAYYRHPDWLGSARLTSTAARGVYSDSAYAPYGEQYAPVNPADPSFTGQNSDTTASLYDFPFREHSPTQGRWISPDPAGLGAVDPTNPQTWNRYAYVMNNPLGYVDPLGLDPCPGSVANVPCFVIPAPGRPDPDGGGSICPGQGYFIIGQFIACVPPANLAYFMYELPNGPSGAPGAGAGSAANNATNNKKQKTNLVMSTCGKDPSGQPDLNASYQTPGGYPFTVPIPLVPAPGGTCVNSPYPGPVGINQCYYVPNSTPGACGGTTYCAPYYVQFTETYPPGNYRPKYPVSPQQEQTCSKVVPVP